MSNPAFSNMATDNQEIWSKYAAYIWPLRPSTDMVLEVNSGKVYNTVPGAVTVYAGQTNRFTLGVTQEKTITYFDVNASRYASPATTNVLQYGIFSDYSYQTQINVPVHFLDNRRQMSGPFYIRSSDGSGGLYTSTAAGSVLSVSVFPASPYSLTSVRLAARSLDNLSDTAFDVTVTATTVLEADGYINTVATGWIDYGLLGSGNPAPAPGPADSGFVVRMPAASLVVTNFPDWLIQKSALDILAGGDGTVPLRAQMQAVISTVSASWNPHPTGVTATSISIWYTTTTVMSRHIPMTFCSTISRPLSYGV